MTIAELVVSIIGDNSKLKGSLLDSESAISKTLQKATTILKGTALVVGLNAVASAFRTIKAETDRLESTWKTQSDAVAKLGSVLKSTGASSWTSSEQIQAMASSLQDATTYGDEAIITMQDVLLGFRSIKGDNFKEATGYILDMATVMGTDLVSSANMVGKALDAPVQGMTALQRVGFVFTEEQKKLVAELEAVGKHEEAQKVILEELRAAFGGASKAVAATASGLKDQLKNALSDIEEEMGRSISNGLAPWRAQLLAMVKTTTEAKKAINDLKEALKLKDTANDTVDAALIRERATLKEMEAQAQETQDAWGIAVKATVSEDQLAAQRAIIQALERRKAAEEEAVRATGAAREKALAAAEAEARAAEELQEYLKKVNAAYAETDAGRTAALEADIAYWENALSSANKTAPKIKAILADLYAQLLEEQRKQEEDQEKATESTRRSIENRASFELAWTKKTTTDKLALLRMERDEALAEANRLGADTTAIYKWYAEERKKITEEETKKTAEEWKRAASEAMASFASAAGSLSQLFQNQEEQEKNKIDDRLKTTLSAIDAEIAARAASGQDYVDLEQQKADATAAAEKAKAEAAYKADHASWQLSVAMAVVDGIAATIKAFKGYATNIPLAIAMSALAASATGLQIAALKKAEPTMPAYASGTRFAAGGATLVGEYGPEIVQMPRGARVLTAHDTQAATRGGLGGGFSVVINSPKAVDVTEAARIMRRTARDLAWRGA